MQQEHISEESFPNIILGICDKCLWCYTCINSKKIIKECPICKTQVSQVPITIEEVCSLEIDHDRGMTLKLEKYNRPKGERRKKESKEKRKERGEN